MIDFIASFQQNIDIHNRKFGKLNEIAEFPKTFLLVDSTECIIQTWQYKSFSGKKKHYTLKYQVAVGANTGEIHHLYGPCLGKIHDSKIWKKSKLGNFLAGRNEYALGDKGNFHCILLSQLILRVHWLLKCENTKKEEEKPIHQSN